MNLLRFLLPSLALCLTAPTLAQWSTDPALNQAVGDAATSQNQAKLAATPDGGVWLSWFDGIGSGWDVRLQKLDFEGGEVFAHNGLLVADRSYSSTQDYGLDTDIAGNALLIFRDDRLGGTEITAAKVDASGVALWGTAGVTLTSSAGFVAAPKIAGTTDGGAVVAWTENSSVRVQKLDASGAPLWTTPLTLVPGTGSYSVADLQATGTGAILSMVNSTGGFSSPRYLVAQKFDGSGASLWGATPLVLFDGGSLQIGNFPAFVSDGAGGGVFAWYSSSPSLQCFAQRVNAAGSEVWPHNGVAVSTTAGRSRVNPHVQFDAASDSVLVAWKEQNTSQSQSGIHAQRFNGIGNRMWGTGGTVLVPIGVPNCNLPRILSAEGPGAAQVLWSEAPTFGDDQLYTAHVTAAGVVDFPRFDLASTPSSKSRLAVARNVLGFGVAAWSDARTDGGDIYAQAVRFDGMLGGATPQGTNYCVPNVNSTGAPAAIQALGSDIASEQYLTLIATDLPSNQFGYFLVSLTQGLISNPGGSQGDLCLAGNIGRYNDLDEIFFSGGSAIGLLELDFTQTPTPTVPTTIVAGQTWNFVAWYRDQNPFSTSNFTDGVSVPFF